MSVATIHGPMEVPDIADDLIRRALEHHGEWAGNEIAIVSRLMPPEARVYDIGACIGTFALGLTRHGPRKIVCVEPEPQTFALLERNLERNASAPWVAENTALGSIPGSALLHAAPGNAGATRVETSAAVDATTRIDTLRALRRRHGPYDLLKLDVEGAEFDVLQGDAGWIRAEGPLVWAECNADRRAFRLLEFCTWAGLAPVYVAYPAFRANAPRNGDRPLYPFAFEAALVFGAGVTPDLVTAAAAGTRSMVRPIAGPADLTRALWLTPRWGLAEWAMLSRDELIALLAHHHKGERIETWLSPQE